jgi:hypothetical protein
MSNCSPHIQLDRRASDFSLTEHLLIMNNSLILFINEQIERVDY